MKAKRRVAIAGLGLAAIAAVVLVTLSLVGGGPPRAEDDIGSMASTGGSTESLSEGLTLKYPVRTDGISGDVYSLPWDELVRQADLVVTGVVGKQGEYQRLDAGAPGLQVVAATYVVDIGTYIKGSDDSSLNFRKVVAREYSGEESLIPEPYSYYIDDPHPLSEGGRYLMALRVAEDGWAELVAEPFRFRLEGGQAVAESGMLADSFLDQRFPTKPEADLIAEVEALVAAQAAETAAR